MVSPNGSGSSRELSAGIAVLPDRSVYPNAAAASGEKGLSVCGITDGILGEPAQVI